MVGKPLRFQLRGSVAERASGPKRGEDMKNIAYTALLATLAVLLLVSVPQNALPMELRAVQQEVKGFAQTSFDGYVKNVLTEKNAAQFGFRSLDEAIMAQLGSPVRSMTLSLRELKKYSRGGGLASLRVDDTAIWFPVVVRGEVRAKLEVLQKGDRLIPGDFGAHNEAVRVAGAIEKMPELVRSRGIREPVTRALLQIPFLRATFLYVSSPTGEFLIPALAMPGRFDLKNDAIYPADEVLTRLREYAKDISDDLIG